MPADVAPGPVFLPGSFAAYELTELHGLAVLPLAVSVAICRDTGCRTDTGAGQHRQKRKV